MDTMWSPDIDTLRKVVFYASVLNLLVVRWYFVDLIFALVVLNCQLWSWLLYDRFISVHAWWAAATHAIVLAMDLIAFYFSASLSPYIVHYIIIPELSFIICRQCEVWHFNQFYQLYQTLKQYQQLDKLMDQMDDLLNLLNQMIQEHGPGQLLPINHYQHLLQQVQQLLQQKHNALQLQRKIQIQQQVNNLLAQNLEPAIAG